MKVEIDTYLFCKENIRVSPEFDVFHTGKWGRHVGTNETAKRQSPPHFLN
jgi:hypothetical protein